MNEVGPTSSNSIFLEAETLPFADLLEETTFTEKLSDAPSNGDRPESLNDNHTLHVEKYGQDVEDGKESSNDDEDLFFSHDHKQRIDYVIVYEDEDSSESEEIRKIYQTNLKINGLELEEEPKENSPNKKTVFLKLHVPWEICLLYAERMRMKLPLKLKEEDLSALKTRRSILQKNLCFSPATADKKFINESFHTAEFARGKKDYFDVRNSETFFSPSQRSRIAYRILAESNYGNEKKDIGIEKLIRKGIYTAAFPLHNRGLEKEEDFRSSFDENPREVLYLTWARWRNIFKPQPLHAIRHYFGEKIGIYFAWLGFYTTALMVPSFVGFVCFIYSIIHFNEYVPVKEICDPNDPRFAGNLTMCPLCDKDCTYWKLHTACRATRITQIFDNESTIFFVIFMLLWATLFLKLWKREQYRLSYQWDLVEYDEETALIRPEYEARVTREKMNPVTHELEPYMSALARFSRSSFSVINVLFWILVVIATVISVTVFRLFIHAFYSRDTTTATTLESLGNVVSPSVLTTLTASTFSVLAILILNKIYEKVALWLTYVDHSKMDGVILCELPRTQLEFEDSFTLKMFCFQFVNYYSYLFYIAFFKNTLSNYPGNYFYLFGRWRWEECDNGGCMYELTLQLFIIMIAKQTWNNILELLIPWVSATYKHWKVEKDKESKANYKRWDQDYDLLEFGQLEFFREYLELVIQYGFVTLFVVAFPLAPLLALLNNYIEIRLDAHKLICSFRRPLAQKAATIGAWHLLLEFLTTLAIVTNSVTLAITSSTIPRLVYFYSVSEEDFDERTMRGYTENSLSVFNVSDFPNRSIPLQPNPFLGENVTECRYAGYRNPPSISPKYHVTAQHWQVLTARVVFIVVMEHFVFFLKRVLNLVISDEPREIRDEVKRDYYLVQNVLLKAEKEQFRNDIKKSLAERQKFAASARKRYVGSYDALENPVT